MHGFIRIRKYKDMWSINVWQYSRRVAKILSDWAYELLQGPNKDRYIPVNITSDSGNPPKGIDMEGLSNLKESHQPLQIITLSEMIEFVPINDTSGSAYYKEIEVLKPIEESSLARIWQHIEDENRSFGIISAYRDINDDATNLKQHSKLRSQIKKYGYIELKAGFKYQEDDEYTLEKSYLVPNIPKDELLKLCKEFEQWSVIYKDSKEFAELRPDGSVNRSYVKAGGKANFALGKEAVKDFFSSLLKGSHAGKKYSFTEFKLLECQGINNHIRAMGLGPNNPLIWYNILEN
jgi:hypothetical protein